jgi:hypothetical protein
VSIRSMSEILTRSEAGLVTFVLGESYG